VDPELAAVVAQLPVFEPGGADDARARARAYSADRPPVPGRDALEIVEVSVPGPPGGDPVRVRTYRPRVGASPRATAIYLHGGGFVAGDLDTEDLRCVRLAHDGGSVVVSVDYRLAPEHGYPAALDDAFAALVWTATSASTRGVDSERGRRRCRPRERGERVVERSRVGVLGREAIVDGHDDAPGIVGETDATEILGVEVAGHEAASVQVDRGGVRCDSGPGSVGPHPDRVAARGSWHRHLADLQGVATGHGGTVGGVGPSPGAGVVGATGLEHGKLGDQRRELRTHAAEATDSPY
jgi:hypothetical protein